MAQKNNANINAKINKVFNQVDPNSITPKDVKELMQDIRDSYFNLFDHANLLGLKEFDSSRDYLVGEAVVKDARVAMSTHAHSGAWNADHFLFITDEIPLYRLAAWNSQPTASGALRRYKGKAYLNTVNNNIKIPSENNSGWEERPISDGRFGQSFQKNKIYVPGDYVIATIDDGNTMFRFAGSSPLLVTQDMIDAWFAGDFDFFKIIKARSLKEIIDVNYLVEFKDYGQQLYIEAFTNDVEIRFESLPKGFYCDLIISDQGVTTKVVTSVQEQILINTGMLKVAGGMLRVHALGEINNINSYGIQGALDRIP